MAAPVLGPSLFEHLLPDEYLVLYSQGPAYSRKLLIKSSPDGFLLVSAISEEALDSSLGECLLVPGLPTT